MPKKLTPETTKKITGIINQNCDLKEGSLKISKGKLHFNVAGTDTAGGRAVGALLAAGLDAVIDEDGSTKENNAEGVEGGICKCWILLTEDGPIFREGAGEHLDSLSGDIPEGGGRNGQRRLAFHDPSPPLALSPAAGSARALCCGPQNKG